jgi:hypothetical protein
MVEVYRTKDKQFIMGLKGGKFEGLSAGAEARVLQREPIPNKRWVTETLIDRINGRQERWEFEHVIIEYMADNENIGIYEIEYKRTKPIHAYLSGKMEFFIGEELLEQKVLNWRSNKKLMGSEWDQLSKRWVTIEKNYIDEDEDEGLVDE